MASSLKTITVMNAHLITVMASLSDLSLLPVELFGTFVVGCLRILAYVAFAERPLLCDAVHASPFVLFFCLVDPARPK